MEAVKHFKSAGNEEQARVKWNMQARCIYVGYTHPSFLWISAISPGCVSGQEVDVLAQWSFQSVGMQTSGLKFALPRPHHPQKTFFPVKISLNSVMDTLRTSVHMRHTFCIFARIILIFPECVLLVPWKKVLPRGDGFPTTSDYQNIFCGFVSQLYWTCLSGNRMPDDVQSEHKIVEINRWWERDGLVVLRVDAPWKNQ